MDLADSEDAGFMTKFKSDLTTTLVALAIFLADTMHHVGTSIGFPTQQGRVSCVAMDRVFGPHFHIPGYCAVDAGWMLFLEISILSCWLSSYKAQMLNIIIGILLSLYMIFIVCNYSAAFGDGPLPLLLGAILGFNYLYRVNYLYAGCLYRYGFSFYSWTAIWFMICVFAVASEWQAQPSLASNIELKNSVEAAFEKTGTWPPLAAFPDGANIPADLLKMADDELAQIFFFPMWSVVSVLVFLPSSYLYATAIIPTGEQEGETQSLVP